MNETVSDDVPSFLGLGHPRLRPPNGYAQVLRDAQVDEALVRRTVFHEELFDKGVPTDNGTPLSARYLRWMCELCAWMGLPWHDSLVAMPTYLQFSHVGWHTDGALYPYGSDHPGAEQYFYVNLQLAGSGYFEIKAKEQLASSHRVGPGDLYVFDQRLEHRWRAEVRKMCKVISFALPASAVRQLAALAAPDHLRAS